MKSDIFFICRYIWVEFFNVSCSDNSSLSASNNMAVAVYDFAMEPMSEIVVTEFFYFPPCWRNQRHVCISIHLFYE
jgi:hypothetical protein